MKKSIFSLNILVLILLFAAAKIQAVEVSAFEQTYYRGTGTPVTETNTFHRGQIGTSVPIYLFSMKMVLFQLKI